MTADLIGYGIAAMRQHGVVDSGDALTLGIGAMTDARWKSFATSMIRAGVYPPTIDLSKAYTLRFVNKKVGMELKSPRAPLARP
jgi:NitT/TauT family transport system substrate-binding protein